MKSINITLCFISLRFSFFIFFSYKLPIIFDSFDSLRLNHIEFFSLFYSICCWCCYCCCLYDFLILLLLEISSNKIIMLNVEHEKSNTRVHRWCCYCRLNISFCTRIPFSKVTNIYLYTYKTSTTASHNTLPNAFECCAYGDDE